MSKPCRMMPCAQPMDQSMRQAAMEWRHSRTAMPAGMVRGVLDVDRYLQILADFPGLVEAEFSMGAFNQRPFDKPIACSANRDRYRKGTERQRSPLPCQDAMPVVSGGQEHQHQHIAMREVQRVRNAREEGRKTASKPSKLWCTVAVEHHK